MRTRLKTAWQNTPILSRSAQHTQLIIAAESKLLIDVQKLKSTKTAIKKRREEQIQAKAQAIKVRLSSEQQKAMELAQEKGGSCLITTLPLEKYGFAIQGKRDFRDLLRMRYRKPLVRLPSICACGAAFSLDHSQICMRGAS